MKAKIFPAVILLTLLMLAGCGEKPDIKNVILISVDTMRADHLGCYGYENIETPNMDRLAREGVRFEKAVTPVPITLPAHVTMLTGTYPPAHGIRNNGNYRLHADHTTLAEMLTEEGYRCGAFVGSYMMDSIFGLEQGFELYSDNYPGSGGEGGTVEISERRGDGVKRDALKWVFESSAEKRFIFIHLYDPHYPYNPPAEYLEAYPGRPYDGEIAFSDGVIGDFLGRLEVRGLLEESLVIITSDHGEDLGDHEEYTHAYFTYDGTLHVPLIFWSTAEIFPAGTGIDEEVCIADIMPTVLDILDMNIPARVQGRSLIPLIEGKNKTEPIYFESLVPLLSYGWSGLKGVRQGGWKFISAPKPELYNLSEDPGETRNLYDEEGKKAREMADLLMDTENRLTAGKIVENERLEGVGMDKFMALGYLGAGSPAGGGKGLPDPKDMLPERNELMSVMMDYTSPGEDRITAGQAVERLNEFLGDHPDNIKALQQLVFFYSEIEDCERLDELIDRLKGLGVGGDEWAGIIADCLKKEGKSDEMFTYLREIVNDNPYAFAAINKLAQWYRDKGVDEKALELLNDIIEKDPNNMEARQILGFYNLDRGNASEAVRNLKIAAERSPLDPLINTGLGTAYSRTGYPDKALVHFIRSVSGEPQNALYRYNLALALLKLGRRGPAKREFSAFLRLAGDDIDPSAVERAKSILENL